MTTTQLPVRPGNLIVDCRDAPPSNHRLLRPAGGLAFPQGLGDNSQRIVYDALGYYYTVTTRQ